MNQVNGLQVAGVIVRRTFNGACEVNGITGDYVVNEVMWYKMRFVDIKGNVISSHEYSREEPALAAFSRATQKLIVNPPPFN